MGLPWLAALRVIPWGTLIASAPVIARAAESFAGSTRARETDAASATDVRALAGRVAELDERDRMTADLVRQLSEQVTTLTGASTVLAARLRWMSWIAGSATVLALTALVFAIWD